jgi:glycine hydroxymethyltransferase
VITTTTHKTLRGPRGGMFLCRAAHAQAMDRAVFPGLQGGPHNHTTAGIAVALHEAAQPEFRDYARQIVANARALAAALAERGFDLVSGGTDNHLILIDTMQGTADRPAIPGKPAAQALEKAGIECNYNTVPFDPRKPFDPSGIRIGTPAVTSCGMKEAEMRKIADWMERALVRPDDEGSLSRIRGEVTELRKGFPAPGIPL